MGLFQKLFNNKKEQRGLKYISPYNEGLLFGKNTINDVPLSLSAVYRCVDLITDNIAILPITIKNVDNEHISEITNHSLNNVFENKTVNEMTMYTLMKMMIQSVLLYGNGFAYIERNNKGDVIGLQFLHPADVIINYDKYNRNLYYTITTIRKNVEPCNIIHLIKNSYDGVNGKSVISYANRSIANGNQTENQALSFFESGCNLSGILSTSGPLNEQQKEQIRTSWSNAYSGSGSGLAVISGGMTYQPISVNANDAQLLESRHFNVVDICRFFGINPVLLGENNGVSLGTMEQIQQQFISHTIQPYITMIEQEFNRKLLKPSESNLKIELDTNELIKTDKNALASYYSTLLDKGILCINEVRKEMGYNAIDGGDKHIIPYSDITQNTINNNDEINDDTQC